MTNFFSSRPFQLAGSNFNPAGFNQIFGSLNTPVDEYQQLEKEYANDRPPFDFSKAGETAQAILAASHPNLRALTLSARLADIGARKASELARQNIDYSIAQQSKYEAERDKRRTDLALKANLLTSIPQTIAQGFGNIAAMNVLGARNATETMAQTLANYPRAQFSSYPYQPQKYFE